MRTTIDLPDDLHRIVASVARDSRTTLSETIARLLRLALGVWGPATTATSDQTGLRTIALGGPVTAEDVRALDDDA